MVDFYNVSTSTGTEATPGHVRHRKYRYIHRNNCKMEAHTLHNLHPHTPTQPPSNTQHILWIIIPPDRRVCVFSVVWRRILCFFWCGFPNGTLPKKNTTPHNYENTHHVGRNGHRRSKKNEPYSSAGSRLWLASCRHGASPLYAPLRSDLPASAALYSNHACRPANRLRPVRRKSFLNDRLVTFLPPLWPPPITVPERHCHVDCFAWRPPAFCSSSG